MRGGGNLAASLAHTQQRAATAAAAVATRIATERCVCLCERGLLRLRVRLLHAQPLQPRGTHRIEERRVASPLPPLAAFCSGFFGHDGLW